MDLVVEAYPAQLMAVTPGGVRANRALRQRLRLSFPLLADPEARAAGAFGALDPTGDRVDCAYLYGSGGRELKRWLWPTPESLREGIEEALAD